MTPMFNVEGNNLMVQHLLNSMPMDIYDGRSSIEMDYLVNDPFCDNSPLILAKDYDKVILQHIPFFCLVKYLLDSIKTAESIKLTSQGNLPTKLVKEMVQLKIIHEPWLDEKADKQIKEFDSLAVSSAKIMAELAGLTKVKKNELSLSKKSVQLLKKKDDISLFHEIFKAFTLRFDWSFNDYYKENDIGQLGFAFSLDLLDKYGSVPRNLNFYTEKYKLAFTETFEEIETKGKKVLDNFFDDTYEHRTFEHFLKWFGLVFVTVENEQSKDGYLVEKTFVFNKIFKFD